MAEPPRLSEILLPEEGRSVLANEDLGNKWIYVQENPVRAGLVQRAEDWPFYLDLISDEKLTASPTISGEA